MTKPNQNPIRGDSLIKHLGPDVEAAVGSSDDLSAGLIAPFVDAATVDFDLLPTETQDAVLKYRLLADASWARFKEHDEQARLDAGLTPEEWAEQKRQNLIRGLGNLATEPDED